MDTPASLIHTYDIKEVHAAAGRQLQRNEFFVYTKEEIVTKEKMFHPIRSSHFTIQLNLDAPLEIKYNLIDYIVQKNSLFIIQPGIIHTMQAGTTAAHHQHRFYT
jgi:hypothetical protein